ncbi:MAG: site-specific integrase [Chloroflexi bacterium]|nr:site-specific integrase [Chloroflexota bacterium]
MTANTTVTAHITANTTIIPAVTAYEIYLNDQGRSPYTVKAFLSDLRLMASFFQPDRELGTIITADLNNYFAWMQKERGVPCSPKTLARRITTTKSFFRWLHRNGVLMLDPAEKVVQHSVMSPLPKILSEDEIQGIMLAADRYRRKPKPDARPYALLYLLLTTGIKKSECLGIHLNHIDLEAPEGPILFIRYASPTNRYKERKLALAEDWLPVYEEYTAQYTPVDKLFPWSPRRLEYLLEDIGEDAALNKHLSFDMCRWTYALSEYRHGTENDKIRQNMGVSKIQWRELNLKLRQLSGNK